MKTLSFPKFIVPMIFFLAIAKNAVPQTETRPTLDSIKQRWQTQRDTVKTAEFECELFRYHDAAWKLSREDLVSFFERLNLVWSQSNDSSEIRKLSESLPIDLKSLPNRWSTF